MTASTGTAQDVVLEAVTKRYGDSVAVQDLTLGIEQGEFVALLGPSGCGKSTTLRMIAGLERPTSGRVNVAGDDPAALPASRRKTKLVFQSYALFPHMTVYDNIAFGPRLRQMPERELRKRIQQFLELVGLTGREDRRPAQLSGGEQQRVAICRALINEPRVLLLDEPFAALDAKIVKAMEVELKQLQKRVGITFVMVTHDQEQALTMSDHVAVMNHGRVEQYGTPETVYHRPANLFVAEFVGDTNVLRGSVVERSGDTWMIRVRDQTFGAMASNELRAGQEVTIAVRPECMVLNANGHGLRGHCETVVFRGNRRVASVAVDGLPRPLYVEIREAATIAEGQEASLGWRPDGAVALPD